MNKKQKSTHLSAVKSAFYLSALATINKHLMGKKSIIWSRLDNTTNAKKMQNSFAQMFNDNVEKIAHEDFLHVMDKSGSSHDKFIEKAASQFSKAIDKHGGDFNNAVLLEVAEKLDALHSKHI